MLVPTLKSSRGPGPVVTSGCLGFSLTGADWEKGGAMGDLIPLGFSQPRSFSHVFCFLLSIDTLLSLPAIVNRCSIIIADLSLFSACNFRFFKIFLTVA